MANREFEKAAMFCESNSTLIPLTFVLAFYVSHVVSRWWAQWNAIPWPDGLAFKINSYCSGLVNICIPCTVWKFQDFSITQILREINFEDSRSAKTAIFAILRAVSFVH